MNELLLQENNFIAQYYGTLMQGKYK